MPKFLNHDGIERGVFNGTFSGATGNFTAWERDLANTPKIVEILRERMRSDWEALPVKMRKPWGVQALDAQRKGFYNYYTHPITIDL